MHVTPVKRTESDFAGGLSLYHDPDIRPEPAPVVSEAAPEASNILRVKSMRSKGAFVRNDTPVWVVLKGETDA